MHAQSVAIAEILNSGADIRDRALFYRHLLLTVSGDKVSNTGILIII